MNEKEFLARQRESVEAALTLKLGSWSEELKPIADLERWVNYHPWLLLGGSFAAAFGGGALISGSFQTQERKVVALPDGQLMRAKKQHRLSRFVTARALRMLTQITQTALLSALARSHFEQEGADEMFSEYQQPEAAMYSRAAEVHG